MASQLVKGLVREPEFHDVAVLYDVVLAFHADLAGGLRGGHGTGREKVVIGDDLSLDETPLEVGMDDAGGLRRRGTLAHRHRHLRISFTGMLQV